jgi:hypothetical protein
MMRALAFVSVCLLAVVSCGSSESKVQADCNTLIDNHVCPKLITCDPGYTTQAACVSEFNQQMGCSGVVSENGNVALCESDLDSESCSTFIDPSTGTISLPTSCYSVFNK